MGRKKLNSDEELKTAVKDYIKKEVDRGLMTLAYKKASRSTTKVSRYERRLCLKIVYKYSI